MGTELAQPSHPYARHLAGVAAACRLLELDDELADIRWRLQRGQLADLDRLECQPMSIRDLQPLNWHRVERLTSPVEGVRQPLVDALSAVGLAPSSLVILIAGGATTGVFLGIPTQRPGLASWLGSVLAPGGVMVPCATPLGPTDFTTLSNGVLFSLVSGTEGASGQPGLNGLTRLLLSPPDDWRVLLRLDPVAFPDIREIEAQLVACSTQLARFGSVSDSTGTTYSLTVEHPDAQLLLDDVKGRLGHLHAGESVGLWDVSLYVSAATEATLDLMTAATGSVLRDETLTQGRWIAQRCMAAPPRATPGPALPTPSSLLSTEDVAQFLTPGASSLPGLDVMTAPPAGRQQPAVEHPLTIGHWSGTTLPLSLDVQDLEGHAFITGTTGTGKSTTVQRILLELANEPHNLPFLIIDPVKADYEELAPLIERGLTVIDATDLVLNVLQPYQGFSVRTHLELVANAFKGSFSLPTPVPYIVAHLFERMIDRATADPPPTLHDLRDDLDPFVASLGYDKEIESNIRAALGLRLSLLLAPRKAERVAAPDGQACLRALLERPAVVQLSSLGDDEERAFLMSVLTLYVAERARVRGRSAGRIRHVTVLEEAHRILPEPSASKGSGEEGDAAGVSARLLTQLLAEIRSYGEAILVVDQSPAAVARDVVRNTNLKIAHRLPDPEDREVVGGSLGLSEETTPSLARLGRGEVVLTTRRIVDAQTLKIRGLPPVAPIPIAPYRQRAADDPRRCCSGSSPAIHHSAEALARSAESVLALAVNSMIRGRAQRDPMWTEALRGLAQLSASDSILVTDLDDGVRCLAWVGLRRALVRHISYGLLDAIDLQSRHQRAFEIFEQRGGQQLRLSRPIAQPTGPFYGCRWCSAVCEFRHLGEASTDFGWRSTAAGASSSWAPSKLPAYERLIYWTESGRHQLEPLLGQDAAVDATRCAVVQFGHRSGMPRKDLDDLLGDGNG